mgnify:CR=1 FL=1
MLNGFVETKLMLNLIIISWVSAALAERLYRRTWVMLLMTVVLVIGISIAFSFLGFCVLTYVDDGDSGKWLIVRMLMSSTAEATPAVMALSSGIVSSFAGSIIALIWAYLRRRKKLNSPDNPLAY